MLKRYKKKSVLSKCVCEGVPKQTQKGIAGWWWKTGERRERGTLPLDQHGGGRQEKEEKGEHYHLTNMEVEDRRKKSEGNTTT